MYDNTKEEKKRREGCSDKDNAVSLSILAEKWEKNRDDKQGKVYLYLYKTSNSIVEMFIQWKIVPEAFNVDWKDSSNRKESLMLRA